VEGFDKGWVDAGTRRVAFYTNLPPGQYRFTVIASNNDGLWNETGVAFGFYLKPHFYQTYTFYLLCFLILSLTTLVAYKLRVGQLHRRTRRLAELVEHRTEELKQCQAKILGLEKQNTEQLMAGGFAHEMRNALAGSKLVLDQALGRQGSEIGKSLSFINCCNLKKI
jgi:Y_Y_Y domain